MFFIGRTRYSLFNPTSTSWRLTQQDGAATAGAKSHAKTAKSVENYKKELYAPARLDLREEIFIQHTLPALAAAARDFDVVHVVSYSESLPEKYQRSLAAAAQRYDFLHLDKRPDGKAGTPLADIAREHVAAGEAFGQYRLDDDDVLSTEYFATMARYVRPEYCGMAVSLPLGVEGILHRGRVTNLRQAHFPMNSMGLMYVCQFGEDGKLQSPRPAPHNMVDRKSPVILDSRKLGYFRFNHLSQDNALRAKDGPSMSSLVKAMSKYPRFEDGDTLERLFPTVASLVVDERTANALPRPTLVWAAARLEMPRPLQAFHLELDHIFAPTARPHQGLVTLDIQTADGHPVPGGASLPGVPKSVQAEVGYYKYLDSRPGSGSSTMEVFLPDGYRVVGLGVRRFGKSLPFFLRSAELSFPSEQSEVK